MTEHRQLIRRIPFRRHVPERTGSVAPDACGREVAVWQMIGRVGTKRDSACCCGEIRTESAVRRETPRGVPRYVLRTPRQCHVAARKVNALECHALRRVHPPGDGLRSVAVALQGREISASNGHEYG